MVKGISRQVVVVKPQEAGLFEQAIFLIRIGSITCADPLTYIYVCVRDGHGLVSNGAQAKT